VSRQAPIDFTVTAWPALLTTELACAYVCLSVASFRFLAAKLDVSPVECGGLAVTRWRKTDLDRLIDSLPARGAEMTVEPANSTDPAAAALQKVLRRAKR
jgi:hypothetical protein